MSRTSLVPAAIVALSLLAPCSLLGQQPPPAGHAPHGPMPKPVNLKVLPKDTSPEELMKIMHGFTQQLGVHCTFCHAEGAAGHPDFASDEKPEKNTARTMMLMTHEINEKYMSQIHDPDAAPDQTTVRCSTCHRGHSMPVTFKPPAEHEGMEHAPAPPKP